VDSKVASDDGVHPYPVIMTSRLKPKYNAVIVSVVEQLGCGKVVQNYSKEVTHLVTAADENNCVKKSSYTYKFLVALTAGNWIVTAKWVLDSAQSKRFISEEAYEVRGDPEHDLTQIPRKYRTASITERSIFHGIHMYLVGTFHQSQVNKEQLATLIEQCGGEVITQPAQAKISNERQLQTIIVTDDPSELSEKDIELCNTTSLRLIHPEWVIESIVGFRLDDPSIYLFDEQDGTEDEQE